VFRAKAPLRVSFAGGGTDVPPFPDLEGGLVLNATVDRYVYGTLHPRPDSRIRIESLDLGSSTAYGIEDTPVFDGNLDLAKAAIGKILDGNGRHGFDVILRSRVPAGSGLGSSSTIVVALIGLLKEFRGLALTDYEIADLAYVIERREVGITGGLQDQYAATFGGFNFIEFLGDRVVVNPLRIGADTQLELEHNLLLCFTGIPRASHQVIDDQTMRVEHREEETLAALRRQKELAIEMKNALLRGRLNEFADLLDEGWRAKRRMSPYIASARIEELYETARRAGALGGKVTGAGGGGYMLFYCDDRKKHRVAEELERHGATIEEFAFVQDGLRTWRADGARQQA
jgi:D-glycero-alpha-D-manno-heptose-7-phosphate kinase